MIQDKYFAISMLIFVLGYISIMLFFEWIEAAEKEYPYGLETLHPTKLSERARVQLQRTAYIKGLQENEDEIKKLNLEIDRLRGLINANSPTSEQGIPKRE